MNTYVQKHTCTHTHTHTHTHCAIPWQLLLSQRYWVWCQTDLAIPSVTWQLDVRSQYHYQHSHPAVQTNNWECFNNTSAKLTLNDCGICNEIRSLSRGIISRWYSPIKWKLCCSNSIIISCVLYGTKKTENLTLLVTARTALYIKNGTTYAANRSHKCKQNAIPILRKQNV